MSKDTVKFLVIAILLMVAVKFLIGAAPSAGASDDLAPAIVADVALYPKQLSSGPFGSVVFVRPPQSPDNTAFKIAAIRDYAPPRLPKPGLEEPAPVFEQFEFRKSHHEGAPKVVVIIDDVGLSESRTNELSALPGPLTLAFLPYAENLAAQTEHAAKAGHELMIHMPMEPLNPDLDTGPVALKTGMEKAEFLRVLKQDVFPAFEGYKGLNNHMGSRLTQDRTAMGWLMQALKDEGLYFIDSKTIHSSVAVQTAHDTGVGYNQRDVFLDHFDNNEKIRAALVQLEKVALRDGYAVAIGHPKARTIEALKEWLPTLDDKGIELVPASAVIERPWDRKNLIAAKGFTE